MRKAFLKYHIWFIGFLGILVSSCNKKHRIWVGAENEQKIFNLKYGSNPRQVMDVFLPSKYPEESPVVIIVHGGAWKLGRKEHMIMIQKYLHKHHIPTVNINYRLVEASEKITYREQLEDIEKVIRSFNSLTAKARLKPNNYILLGESAGAHLSLLYGYRNPNQIKKIISLSGPTDFYSEDYLKSIYSRYTSPTIQDVVGIKFNRKKLSEEFKIASPVANVSKVPTLLFQGENDILVNKKQGLKLDSVLTENHIPHKLIFMKKTGHIPRIYNHKKRDSLILPEILKWIQEKL